MMLIGFRRHAAAGERPTTDTAGRSTKDYLVHGAIGGLLAGVVFAMFEMLVAAVRAGDLGAIWMPLRMIGAMVLGEAALMPDYSLATAALTGLVVHMMLSAIFGVVFAGIIRVLPMPAHSTKTIISAAGVYGLLLWLVNFYVIAPLAGWRWFPEGADQFWQGFVAHTFLFGTVLGIYLAVARRRAPMR